MYTLATGLSLLAVGVLSDLPLVALWGQIFIGTVAVAYPLTLRELSRVTAGVLSLTGEPPIGPGGGLSARGDFRLRLQLSNVGSRPFRELRIQMVGSRALAWPPAQRLGSLRGGARCSHTLTGRALHVGPAVIHGAHLGVSGPGGFFRFRAYQPLDIRVRVLPRTASVRNRRRIVAGATGLEALLPSTSPVRGLGSDVRELREHHSGDPFKHIAWKATARTGRLIVKEFESDLSLSVYALLDIGPSMRWGALGATRLDTAIDWAFHLARLIQSGTNRFGLASFDARVFAFTRAAGGHKALHQTIGHLLELHAVVDAELTDVRRESLVSRVAEFIRTQEGLDLRAPDLSSLGGPEMGVIHPYDEEAVLHQVRQYLAADPQALRALSHYVRAPSPEPNEAMLRMYCRLRGLDLPYRSDVLLDAGEQGLAQAVQKAVTDRSSAHILVVFSDLLSFRRPEELLPVLRLARAHRHRLVFVCPPRAEHNTPASPEDPLEAELRGLLTEELSGRQKHVADILRSHGVRVSLDTTRLEHLGPLLQRGGSRRSRRH